MLRLTFLLLLAALPLRAEDVVLGLSQNRIGITANFDGSEILVFGAVKREAAIPDEPLGVIVTIAGPSLPLTVRRKDKRFGIWVNVDSFHVDEAPSFYAVATSGTFSETISLLEDAVHKVSVARAIHSSKEGIDYGDRQAFLDAVIRIREDKNLYQTLENSVVVDEQTLFRTDITLPANLTEGDYTARILLTRSGKVVSEYTTMIDVRKVGIERFLFKLSREMALVYGLMSLAIAIAAGWAASAVFRIFQRD